MFDICSQMFNIKIIIKFKYIFILFWFPGEKSQLTTFKPLNNNFYENIIVTFFMYSVLTTSNTVKY